MRTAPLAKCPRTSWSSIACSPWTRGDYIKVCSNKRNELDEWSVRSVDG
jgi:hypothetical protein